MADIINVFERDLIQMLKLFRKNKAFCKADKLTYGLPIEKNFSPKGIYLSVSETCVSVGEEVGIGSLVGKNSDGASVCSGISGKISEIKKMSDSKYGVKIENDLAKRQGEYLRPFGDENNIRVTDITPEMLISVMKKASVKTRGHQISANDRTVFQRVEDSFGKARQIVINCVGGEPYDSSFKRIMLENASDVINGMKLVMAVMKIGEGVLLLDSESNECANTLSSMLAQKDNIKVVLADMAYPTDNEHNVIYTLTSIEISRKRSAERVGCVVFDLHEILAVARAFIYGEVETCEIITVSGDALSKPMNLKVPYGTKISEIADYCGVNKDIDVKIIAGGVLRGKEVGTEDVFEVGMSPLVILNAKRIPSFNGVRCMRCGSCMRACPMLLMPMYLSLSGFSGVKAFGKMFDISACTECGVCQYVCPAGIPILKNIRRMKDTLLPDTADKNDKTAENKPEKEENSEKSQDVGGDKQ